ncbi:MAG TPA: hypothetical protein VJR71_15825 [Pseudolabrys sp.]|nr:hypothetical protein [Pseudolabrys sp.]
MNAITPTSRPGDYCDDGLRLRHKLQKLRWMGFEREADQLAHDISELTCQQPVAVPGIGDATD